MKKALGIDLGTTNSAMAIVKNGQPEIIPIGANDETILRSAIYFSKINGKNRVFFGKDAITRGTEVGKIDYFKNDFKRDMARQIENEVIDHKRVNAEILSALILHEFKLRANQLAVEMGQNDLKDVVITVPAYFTSEQRVATKRAGRLAGFNVLRIINEPTSAAIAYANKKGVNGNVLVYDLGGGTFDVTVMNVNNDHYDILATDGNHRLGGLDFDKRLVKLVKDKLERQGLNMTMLTPKEEMQLRYQVEKMKINLSINDFAFYELISENGDYGVEVSRQEFEEVIADLIKDTELKVMSTVSAAGLTLDSIDHVILVGGSTRIPIIREMMTNLIGKRPEFDINPDTIVAEGASIIADLIVNHQVSFNETQQGEDPMQSQIVIRDVTSQGIGMLLRKNPNKSYPFVGDFFNSVVVPRNTQIPAKFSKKIFAVADGQSNFQLRLTEGNYDNPMNVKPILKIVEYLSQGRRKGQEVAEIRFEFDEEQIIHVHVIDSNSNQLLSSYKINANIDRIEEVAEEDLSESQALFNELIS
ncbi:Hsp70 family protein [Streptococcus pluranimalium]|uniref:Hsp70 family protein n=1 Tax=Streptococcus pluranimalium TaxID=82348 RepID=UPI004046ED90